MLSRDIGDSTWHTARSAERRMGATLLNIGVKSQPSSVRARAAIGPWMSRSPVAAMVNERGSPAAGGGAARTPPWSSPFESEGSQPGAGGPARPAPAITAASSNRRPARTRRKGITASENSAAGPRSLYRRAGPVSSGTPLCSAGFRRTEHPAGR